MLRLVLTLSVFATVAACGHKHHHGHHKHQHTHNGSLEHPHGEHSMHHDFKDAEKWSKRFDREDRVQWQKPQEVIALMNIESGKAVAEIGSGTGYMLPYLSKATGNKGKVFAMDVEPTLIEFMKNRVKKENLNNVKVELMPTDSPHLSDKKVSRVLFVNTWHHISNREDYSKKLYQQTSKGTEIFLVEPEPGTGGPGPKDAHRMSAKALMAELTPAGFECETPRESLPHQYIVKCKK